MMPRPLLSPVCTAHQDSPFTFPEEPVENVCSYKLEHMSRICWGIQERAGSTWQEGDQDVLLGWLKRTKCHPKSKEKRRRKRRRRVLLEPLTPCKGRAVTMTRPMCHPKSLLPPTASARRSELTTDSRAARGDPGGSQQEGPQVLQIMEVLW